MSVIDGIGVVITACNAANSIVRAINSALSQPQVCEVIVVDDASSDGTSEAAGRACDGSGRLQVICLETNRGPSAARNLAISSGSAPFIAILDADDYFLRNRFSDIIDSDWDFIADNIVFVEEDYDQFGLQTNSCGEFRSRNLSFEEFVQRNISERGKPRAELGFLKPVIRRSSWLRLRLSYDERARLGEDFIVYSTALSRGARFLLLERCGYVAEVRAQSLSNCHSTADLAALAQADRELIEELSGGRASFERLKLLGRHLLSIERKIAIRSLLDRKHEVGAIHAMLELFPSPLRLAYTTADLLHDKLRRLPSSQAPSPRLLMQPEEFQGSPALVAA